MLKRLITFFALIPAIAISATKHFWINNLCYQVTCEPTSTTYGYVDVRTYYGDIQGELNIPAMIEGYYIVHGIMSNALAGLNLITSVTIPNSIGPLGIGNNAFSNCEKLTNVNWDVVKLCSGTCENLFTGSPVKTITFGKSVKFIGYGPFNNMTSLESVKFIGNVTSIDAGAFSGCSGLTKVEISDLAAWCGISFGNGFSNPLEYAHHLYMNGSEIKDLFIPNSVTSIGKCAFGGCSGLTSVTIPNSVTSIGNWAFYGCSGLTTVNWNAKECNDFSNHCLFESLSGITSFNFGNKVERIPANLCHGLSGLKSLTIPNSVTSIGGGAFQDCQSIQHITIGSGVRTIEDNAFNNCKSLIDVTNYSEVPQEINANVFDGIDVSRCRLYVPENSYYYYIREAVWKDFDIQIIGGVEGVEVDEAKKEVEGYYDLNGIRIEEPARGQVNIVRYTDGSSQKFVVK